MQPWAGREIDLCSRVAEHFPKNYYAWAHRYYVASKFFNHWPDNGEKDVSGVSEARSQSSFFAAEVRFIEKWLSQHVSDHSAAHYGAEALRLHLKHGFRSGTLLKESCAVMEWALDVTEKTLLTSRQLIKRYTSHEVIWIWRRHVGQIFLDLICGEFGMENLVGSEAVEALDRFLQAEVYDVFEVTNGKIMLSDEKTKIRPEEQEDRFGKIHSLTYLLWLLDQLQRHSALIDCVQDKARLNRVRDVCKDTLAQDNSISYNTWRLRKVSETSCRSA